MAVDSSAQPILSVLTCAGWVFELRHHLMRRLAELGIAEHWHSPGIRSSAGNSFSAEILTSSSTLTCCIRSSARKGSTVRLIRTSALFLTTILILGVAAHAADKKLEKQNDVREMTYATLQRLYAASPSAKAAVASAAGYAAFSNLGIKILLAGSGNGRGMAVNNKSKKETFMKMLELQAG